MNKVTVTVTVPTMTHREINSYTQWVYGFNIRVRVYLFVCLFVCAQCRAMQSMAKTGKKPSAIEKDVLG